MNAFGRPVSLCAVLGVIVLVADASNSGVLETDVETMLIYLVMVVALYMFSGMSGVLSFGHPAFVLIGAYAAAWLTIPPAQKAFLFPALPSFILHSDLGTVPAVLIAGGAAAAAALVVSVPVMRLNGIAASLATFAVLVIVNVIADNWSGGTRGTQSVFGLPQNTTMQSALVFGMIAIWSAWGLERLSVGKRLRAAREDDVAARASGISVAAERRVAFVVSGFFFGISGFLFAQFLGSFNPDVFYTQMAFLTITMLVVGGLHSLTGAVVGTILIQALSDGLQQIESGVTIGPLHIPARVGLVEVGVAVALLASLIFRPEGLAGSSGLGRRLGSQFFRLGRLGAEQASRGDYNSPAAVDRLAKEEGMAELERAPRP